MSGHSASFGYHAVKAALKAYDQIKEEEEQDIRPLYKNKSWQYKERPRTKRENKRTGLDVGKTP